VWEAIAAKVDAATGRPIEGARPGHPVTGGSPCAAYIGPDGAGHYVKMVHNGIEYADMQVICEAYHFMRDLLGMSTPEMADVFALWNEGDLDSFLIEITADILRQDDPATGEPFVDVVLDAAAQKGTGAWTAMNALEIGAPAPTIAEAVFARSMSAQKEQRIKASERLAGPRSASVDGNRGDWITALRDALYCSKICAYAQGFALMAEASRQYEWGLDFGSIAQIWRGGCIIRAQFLQKITDAFERERDLANLLLDEYFREAVGAAQPRWRRVVSQGVSSGLPIPAFASALAYYDSYRTARLPANLLQAQRDFFGAHTYERVDQPRGRHFHIDWPDPKRPQTEA
jgi:6-phosphogluconate dehydrogenase